MRGEVASTRERLLLSRDHLYVFGFYFMFSGFTFGADSISEEVAGFSPLWLAPRKILCVSCLLCFIVVHDILSVKDPKIIMLA